MIWKKGNLVRLLILAIILALCFTSFAGCGTGGTEETGGEDAVAETDDTVYTFDVVCSWVKGNLNYDRLEIFKSIVEEKTGGRVMINILGGPEVFAADEAIEAVMSGAIDGCYTSTGYISGYIPEAEAISASDMSNAEMNASGGTDLMREIMAEDGIYYLMAVNEVEYTPFNIYLNEPVATLDDMKGRAIRASLGIWTSVAAELGMAPSPLAFTEVFSALEQGLIEGYMAPAFSGMKEGFFEYTKHMIFPGIGRPGTIMVLSMDSWNELPADLQDVILGNVDYIAQEWDDKVDSVALSDNIAALEAAGGSVIELSEADGQKLTGIFNKIAWETIAKNCPDQAVVEELKDKFLKK